VSSIKVDLSWFADVWTCLCIRCIFGGDKLVLGVWDLSMHNSDLMLDGEIE